MKLMALQNEIWLRKGCRNGVVEHGTRSVDPIETFLEIYFWLVARKRIKKFSWQKVRVCLDYNSEFMPTFLLTMKSDSSTSLDIIKAVYPLFLFFSINISVSDNAEMSVTLSDTLF